MGVEGGSGGLTTQQWLVRLDGKLDQQAATQQADRVKLAILEERMNQAEARQRENLEGAESWRSEVRRELAEAKQEASLARAEGQKLGKKLAYATGTVSAFVIAANFAAPYVFRHVGT